MNKLILVLITIVIAGCASSATRNALYAVKDSCATSFEKTQISDGCIVAYCATFTQVQNQTYMKRDGIIVCRKQYVSEYHDMISIGEAASLEHAEDMKDLGTAGTVIGAGLLLKK